MSVSTVIVVNIMRWTQQVSADLLCHSWATWACLWFAADPRGTQPPHQNHRHTQHLLTGNHPGSTFVVYGTQFSESLNELDMVTTVISREIRQQHFIWLTLDGKRSQQTNRKMKIKYQNQVMNHMCYNSSSEERMFGFMLSHRGGKERLVTAEHLITKAGFLPTKH